MKCGRHSGNSRQILETSEEKLLKNYKYKEK